MKEPIKIKEELESLDTSIAILEDKREGLLFDMDAFGVTEEKTRAYNDACFKLAALKDRRSLEKYPGSRIEAIRRVPIGNY